MKRFTYLYLIIGVLTAAALVACTGGTKEPATTSLHVVVSIPPLAYFVERIGGEHVTVDVLAETGQDPHTFEPTPRQVTTLSTADIFFTIGLPFETQIVERIKDRSTRLAIVDTTVGIQRRLMFADADHDHHEEHTGHMHEDAADPHIWLSPPLIEVQAQTIADALQKADPAHAEDYRRNLETFLGDVKATDARIRNVLAPYKGEAFYVFHPSFGYFANAYGLHEETVEVEGKSPTPKQLQALVNQARDENVKIIFVQPQFDRRSADAVANSIGATAVLMDPLAKDVLGNLETMAAEIARAMSRQASP